MLGSSPSPVSTPKGFTGTQEGQWALLQAGNATKSKVFLSELIGSLRVTPP